MSQSIATLGMGCFWCTEAVFQQLNGVISIMPGYIGGSTKNPTYEDVCSGDTGHVEVAQITFDASQTSFPDLLSYFWRVHNPTTMDQQEADKGSQYRSVIFFHDEEQKIMAEQSKRDAQQLFESPIVTEIRPASVFYPAEEYHRNYYKNNSDAPYCQYVIVPKLEKLQKILKNKITSH